MKDSKEALFMILDIESIYTKNLNKINRANKLRDEIRSCSLKFKSKLYIRN